MSGHSAISLRNWVYPHGIDGAMDRLLPPWYGRPFWGSCSTTLFVSEEYPFHPSIHTDHGPGIVGVKRAFDAHLLKELEVGNQCLSE